MSAVMVLFSFVSLLVGVPVAFAAPPGFPASGNGLWFTYPGTVWAKECLPIGNGYLAAMTPGGTAYEETQLNIESLWTGGPFQDPSYNGGNKQPSEQEAAAEAMQTIRQTIFQSSDGLIDDIEALTSDAGTYGSYAGAGYLLSTIDVTGDVTDYGRWLDMDEGVVRVAWTQSNISFFREFFCSHPTQSCTEYLQSLVTGKLLPDITYAFSTLPEGVLPTPNVTCLDNTTIVSRGFVDTPGMLYELIGKVHSSGGSVSCETDQTASPPNSTITVSGAQAAWITWVGSTEFSQDAGDEAHNFTFRGPDPHNALVQLVTHSATSSYKGSLASHITDYKATMTEKFSLSLGQTPDFDNPIDVIKGNYQLDVGDPYVEWLTFNLGRYLLASSARGLLPANLQGKWASGWSNAWSADYHSNINIQMNYWSAEMSNLDVTQSLFDYFEKNWAPRGSYTAQVLYNINRGWVTHNEMNIFGHTGMKGGGNTASWADYPESNVWMMVHVWDHFDYTNDVDWWKSQGWPLLKSVAGFHLDKLIPDLHFNDSTLVVAPCNSPEQVPITLGCAHAQQLIWQLFNAVEKGYAASGDTDTAFIEEVRVKRQQMDKGIRIGSWGQLQEWKVDMDSPTDTHRHLSHLVGLYPGYAIASYDPSLQGGLEVNGSTVTYTPEEVIGAATISLIHRGDGKGPDADSGWEKAWRAGAWAQLQNATEFYHELTYTLSENLGPNLFSLYDPSDPDPIFQIDANLGFPGAVLNALLQAPDTADLSIPLNVTILPALPSQWASGSMKGARVRGGMTVDLEWQTGKPTSLTIVVDSNPVSRPVNVIYKGSVLSSFKTFGGMKKTIDAF